MKKHLGIFMASALLLGACSSDEETSSPASEEITDVEENENKDETEIAVAEKEEEIITELDDETRAELDQDFEEIDWDKINLTEEQFDTMLYEFQNDFNLENEEDDEMTVSVDSIDFSGDTIEFTLTNTDDSGFSEITNGFYAIFIDSLYRQLYLRSDYSDGTTHPHIIIQQSNGEIISDQEDFIEFEE